jgi:hypothetical protein
VKRRWTSERARLFAADVPGASGAAALPSPGGARARADLVGRDFADPPRRVRSRARLRLPIAVGTLLAALLLVTLRVHILRVRYALAEVASQEEALLEQKRQMTVRVRELRDPARLRRLAAERGFGRPERVLTLELPVARTAPGGGAP